jgi:hypothetical protein
LNNSVITIYIIWAIGMSENLGEGPSFNLVAMIPPSMVRISLIDMARSRR